MLREVDTADHALRLSDTDLVLLAAAASEKSASTPRLELYPRDLSAERAVKISQVGSIAEGAFAGELVRRVLARFPDLYESNRPTPDTMPALLDESRLRRHQGVGFPAAPVAVHADFRDVWLARPDRGSPGTVNRHRRGGRARHGPAYTGPPAWRLYRPEGPDPRCRRDPRSGRSTRRGHPVNVTAEFVRTLRAVVTEQGRPKWETVLKADSPDASSAARTGFAQLLHKTWTRLEEDVRASGNSGIVLLHDATPFARYTGGAELLAKLAVAARDAAEFPVGLWLLCPMEDPQGAPQLDRVTVGVIPGDAEQLFVPGEFAEDGGKDLKAS